jgi:CSLREA domain-containing protein
MKLHLLTNTVAIAFVVTLRAATITVNSTNDTQANDGQCTLREGIIAANTNTASGTKAGECVAGSPGLDSIVFDIGSGNPTININNPSGGLPAITEPVSINGNTGGATRVVINGASATGNVSGITITGGSSIIRSLIINQFAPGGNGAGVEITGGAGGNVVADCYLGTDATGMTAMGNAYGVHLHSSSNNAIGGTTATDRNVMSGNAVGIGIDKSGGVDPTTGNVVEGNYIGANASGNAALPNSTGVELFPGLTSGTIGGTVAGARNVISGNNFKGIDIEGSSVNPVTGITIEGNYIGTNAAGTADLHNGSSGIVVSGPVSNITIGGTTAGARNVISSNPQSNILLQSNGGAGSNNMIEGNFIGLNAAGTAALGSTFYGIRVEDAPSNIIGGNTTGAGNVISGNTYGILLIPESAGTTDGTQILGNYIGTDATGSAAVANDIGIFVDSNVPISNTTISGNLISGNTMDGISFTTNTGGVALSNLVQGNLIGTKTDGTTALGNSGNGISVNFSTNVSIGGSGAADGNTIAFNGSNGVLVSHGLAAILGNSIFSNTGLGIDLGGDGVTLNDAGDVDTGPNNLQNFPVLTSVSNSGGMTTINGRLNSAANTMYRIEFFANDSLDSTGYGEGQTYLGFISKTTDGSGNVTFSKSVTQIGANQRVTATATDPNGNTSEFSSTIGQLLNVSTRMEVLTGGSVLIGGFIIGGSGNMNVLLRALGPTLQQFGINGFLADPTLDLYSGQTLLASNDNWKDSPEQAQIQASGKAPPNDLESAILESLAAGNYTAIVRGKNNTTGIGLVEAYDLDGAVAITLTNISTRGFVDIGQNVMIGGVISGNGSVRVIVRALGPTLTQFGVPNVLADPVLDVRNAQGTSLATNDNWKDTQQAEIQASGKAPPNDNESAIIIVRPAANTTAIVSGKNGTTGNALVEVYTLPPGP